jgi:hypothetical protein
LSVREISRAEIVLLRHVQSTSYASDLASLRKHGVPGKNSPLKSLAPHIDADELIRVGGRLKYADIDGEMKHPIVVPHTHPVSSLIARSYHQRAHLGTEWVVSQIRERFWVTKIRNVVKSVRHKCVQCRKLFANPCSQRMADHIQERLQPGYPPFTFVGLDCFGPFVVKRGRSEIKRYGCVFSCLCTRAIHLEVLYDMSTDSFLNAFRRFVSRRGVPVHIWSDNGSNFVGAKVEIDKGKWLVDPDIVKKFSCDKGIEWTFNPPHSSHR